MSSSSSSSPGAAALVLTEKDGTIRVEIHAKPRAKKSRIVGVCPDGSLEVALMAPPVDGAANEELVRVLSKVLEIPKRDVEILRGETAHKKLVGIQIAGSARKKALTVADVMSKISEQLT